MFLCRWSYVQEATEKDEQEQNEGAEENLKPYLADAYLHPIFHSFEEFEFEEVKVDAVRADKHNVHVSSPPVARIQESPVTSPPHPNQYYTYESTSMVDQHHAHFSSPPAARIEESPVTSPPHPSQYYTYEHDYHYNFYHHHDVQHY